ncbi:MAG: 3-methyl-2-oxobutanoate hydroxymethyltransferase [Planctomycetota bacterium]|nr:3-methyl-2-oxobutanoate hydroxymethyltransferase [Planctomycetota bacterium]
MSRITIQDLKRWKQEAHRWVCLTSYDAPSARVLAAAEVPVVLVGDSLGNVILGHESTVPVTMEDMVRHAAAVRRGAPDLFVVGDMPFLAAQISDEEAVRNAGRLIQQGGADAVKLEGGGPRAATIRRIVEAGIPVMGHLGLTPQNATQLGGHKVQGSDPRDARRIAEDAQALEEAGAFAIVLECVPTQLAATITRNATVPIIGIGAGEDVDAQILVFHDLIGWSGSFKPRFVRRYAQVEETMIEAVRSFQEDVAAGAFPSDSESFRGSQAGPPSDGIHFDEERQTSG